MVVVFALMPHRTHDLEQHDIACATERDDQFAQERAGAGFAAGGGGCLQEPVAVPDGLQRASRDVEIAGLAVQLTLQRKVEQRLRSCAAASLKLTLNAISRGAPWPDGLR